MKVVNVKMICPQCGKEYENKELISYSSMFENAAKEFMKNNKKITCCEVCNVKLIKSNKL